MSYMAHQDNLISSPHLKVLLITLTNIVFSKEVNTFRIKRLGYGHIFGTGASLVAQAVKNLPTTKMTQVLPLSGEYPLTKGMATHYSILA